ncbi:hypothetical protein N9F21_04080, partial [Porticoccaceae bacterium]|nr:hypothetical protein [Porticoccaceae bacterium]
IGYGDGLNWYAYVGNDPINFGDPFGLCQVVEGEIKECDVTVEDEGSLTEEQQGQVGEIKANLVAIGELIQEKGDDQIKEAWKSISKIKIDVTSTDKSNNSDDRISLSGQAVQSNNKKVSDRDHQRFVITHEIVHSEPVRKSAMSSAIKRQKGYDPSVIGSPTRIQEQRTDRKAYKFLYSNQAISQKHGYLGQQEFTGYWP